MTPTSAALLALGAALACCALPPGPVPVGEARAHLVGQPAASVSACMGQPPIQRRSGDVSLWSYPSAAATAAAPVTLADPTAANFAYTPLDGDPLGEGLGIAEGPAAPSGCIVNVTLDTGIARAVTYVGPNGRRLRDDPECSALVRACVR